MRCGAPQAIGIYFMLVSEAAQLVLQAGAMGKGGETFFLDMGSPCGVVLTPQARKHGGHSTPQGEPVRIGDLAENLIRLSGLEPAKEIPIEVIGLRPGERLDELLVMDGEELLPTEHEKVFMVESHRLDPTAFRRDFDVLKQLLASRDRDKTVAQLRAMASRY